MKIEEEREKGERKMGTGKCRNREEERGEGREKREGDEETERGARCKRKMMEEGA